MPIKRLFILCLALLLFTAPALAAAQDDDDETPAADNGATPVVEDDDPTATLDPAVGDEVSYLDEDGDEIAVITVLDVIDPFEDFEEFSEPAEGMRYVAVEVEVRSTGDELVPNAFDFRLHTVDGFVYSSTFISREDADELPDLESVEVEEGDSISGAIFFAVPEEAELARVLWQPASERLLILADLRQA